MKNNMRTVWDSMWSDIRGTAKMYPLACAFVVVGIILTLLIFCYVDGISLTAWSVEVWDAIAEGPIHDYSANIRCAPHGAMTARYILLLFPWAIWNFPLWLTHQLDSNVYIGSTMCTLWSKFGLIVCAFVVGLLCCRIVFQINKEKEAGWTATILFWGSGTLAISIGVCAQDEIFYVLALMCALKNVLDDKKLRSLCWMAIAVLQMPAMILPCLLLILYSFKEFLYRIAIAIVVCIPYIANQILVPIQANATDQTGFFSNDYLGWFFNRASFAGGYSAFGVITCILIALQFFNRYDSKEEEKQYLLYHVTCLMVAMGLFSWSHVYRYFLCVPFLVISICSISNFQKRIAAIAGLCVFEYCRFMGACFENYWFASFSMTKLAKEILNIEPYADADMYSLLTKYFPFISGKEYLVLAVTCACGGWVLWLIYPRGKQKIECNFSPKIIVNIYSMCAFLFVAVFCVLLYKTDIIRSNIDGDEVLGQAITSTYGLSEYYYAKDHANVISIAIRPVTWARDYPDNQMLCIDIVDAVNGETVGTSSIYADDLPNNQQIHSNHQNWRHTAGRGAFSAAEAPKTQEALMAFKFLGQRQLGKLPSRWVSTILMVATN